MTSNHAPSLLGPPSLFYNFSLRNFFWSTCTHPANETWYFSNQYLPQVQHLFSTPEGLDIGTSFLPLYLNGEPILLCRPHTMETRHQKHSAMMLILFDTFLCLLMMWTTETARHACEQHTVPSVAQKLLQVPCFTTYCLTWSRNNPVALHLYTQRMGCRRRFEPCPHTVNITYY